MSGSRLKITSIARPNQVNAPASMSLFWHRDSATSLPVAYQDAKGRLTWNFPASWWKALIVPLPTPPLDDDELPEYDSDREVEWIRDAKGGWVGEDRVRVNRKINLNALSLSGLRNLSS